MNDHGTGGTDTAPAVPPLCRVDWHGARRIIATRHPPIDLFEDIADPTDWPLIASGEARTNPRLSETVGMLDRVPSQRRAFGPGASYVMAPFVHASPDRPGRFHDGHFGAYYAADRFETALAEVTYHRARFLRATHEPPGWLAQTRELVGRVRARLHDLRGAAEFTGCLAPDDYTPSQGLARRLRSPDGQGPDTGGSDGLVYPSVRDPGGICIAAFWPDVPAIPVQGRSLSLHFDGTRIDMIRDAADGTVYRLMTG